VFAAVENLSVRDQAGDYFTLDTPRRAELTEFDVVCCAKTHLRSRLYHHHTFAGAHPPKTLVVNDPAQVRNAPEKFWSLNSPS